MVEVIPTLRAFLGFAVLILAARSAAAASRDAARILAGTGRPEAFLGIWGCACAAACAGFILARIDLFRVDLPTLAWAGLCVLAYLCLQPALGWITRRSGFPAFVVDTVRAAAGNRPLASLGVLLLAAFFEELVYRGGALALAALSGTGTSLACLGSLAIFAVLLPWENPASALPRLAFALSATILLAIGGSFAAVAAARILVEACGFVVCLRLAPGRVLSVRPIFLL